MGGDGGGYDKCSSSIVMAAIVGIIDFLQAERDAVEHEARAHKDHRVLGEALQRSKEEALLLARARDMRARLIEQMQVMARSKQLQATLCTWRHFCGRSRKTRVMGWFKFTNFVVSL